MKPKFEIGDWVKSEDGGLVRVVGFEKIPDGHTVYQVISPGGSPDSPWLVPFEKLDLFKKYRGRVA